MTAASPLARSGRPAGSASDPFIAGSKLKRFSNQLHRNEWHSLHFAADDATGDRGGELQSVLLPMPLPGLASIEDRLHCLLQRRHDRLQLLLHLATKGRFNRLHRSSAAFLGGLRANLCCFDPSFFNDFVRFSLHLAQVGASHIVKVKRHAPRLMRDRSLSTGFDDSCHVGPNPSQRVFFRVRLRLRMYELGGQFLPDSPASVPAEQFPAAPVQCPAVAADQDASIVASAHPHLSPAAAAECAA